MADPIIPDPAPSTKRGLARRRLLTAAALVLGGLVVAGGILAVVLNGGVGGWTIRDTQEPTAESEDATGYPPGSPDRPASERPVIEPEASDSDVLDELRAAFGKQVTGVRIQAAGGDAVRIDVDTSLQFAAQDVATALDIAKAAAESKALLDAYPTVTVSAYVWPEDGKTYMTRATAVWVEGVLSKPIDTYTDEALK